MATGPPEGEGYAFFLSWGIIEWVITGAFTLGGGVAAWVWGLGAKVETLKGEIAGLKVELKQVKAEHEKTLDMIRRLGSSVDVKINEETERLEGRMDKLTEKVESVREELPSRSFIEGQLFLLQQRMDRSMDQKLVPR